MCAPHTAEELKQRCYLEIAVPFNRDIPTLVTSSRVPEQTQLDTYQLVSIHRDSCRSPTLAERIRFEEFAVTVQPCHLDPSLKISQKTFTNWLGPSSGWVSSFVQLLGSVYSTRFPALLLPCSARKYSPLFLFFMINHSKLYYNRNNRLLNFSWKNIDIFFARKKIAPFVWIVRVNFFSRKRYFHRNEVYFTAI